MQQKILLLGDPRLYQTSDPVTKDELPSLAPLIADLEDTLMAYRKKYGAGRAIAAPQIGAFKRLLYMNTSNPVAFINPYIEFPDDELMQVKDDCMSFPGLWVMVMRHKRCVIHYKDMEWKDREMRLEGDLSELLQHEFDHLDGILATMRAIDNKSFYFFK